MMNRAELNDEMTMQVNGGLPTPGYFERKKKEREAREAYEKEHELISHENEDGSYFVQMSF